MSNPWFRLHTDILSDEKILSIGISDRWYFVAICCLKCEGMLDKYSGAELDRKVRIRLGLDNHETDELKRRLVEEKLIDDAWNPTAWDTRQYKSDTSTARVRKHREKQRDGDMKRFRNVSVTPPDTDTDTEKKGLTPQKILEEVLPKERAKQLVAYRRRFKSPFTDIAARRLANNLAQFQDPVAAADEMEANGWKSIEPGWKGAPPVKSNTDMHFDTPEERDEYIRRRKKELGLNVI